MLSDTPSMNESTIDTLRSRQRALVEFGLLAIRERSLQTILDHAVTITRSGVRAPAAKILELRTSGSLLVRAGEGWPDGIVGQLELPPGRDSQAAYALRERNPVTVTDLPSETRFSPAPVFLELGVRSGINVVIEQTPQPFGVLEVDDFEPRTYDEDDIEFLQSVANILSVAIARNEYETERDHLLDVAAHELRNPLAIVLGYSERLERRARQETLSPQLLEALAEIHGAAQRLHRLVEMLLDLGLARREMSAVEELPLQQLLDEAVRQAEEQFPGIAFERNDSRVQLQTTPDVARLVLGNLVGNAAKYARHAPVVRIDAERIDGRVEVRVRDTCGGIAGEELDRLFDRYFRGQSAVDIRGFGLGLFVVHRSAELLGWKVDVQNYPGEGCEFIVTIPDDQVS